MCALAEMNLLRRMVNILPIRSARPAPLSARLVCAVLAGASTAGVAHAERMPGLLPDGWFPDARCAPALSGAAGDAAGDAAVAPGAVISLRGSYAPGTVPPFRAAARDRMSVGPSICARLPARTHLSLAWDWLRDQDAIGGVVSGPGDIRVGTAIDLLPDRLLSGPGMLSLGWSVKLPDASDEGELGSDETDITLGISGGWRAENKAGYFFFRGGAALAILGDPLRFADQDDLLLLRGEGGWGHGGLSLIGAVSAAPQSDRNPARIDTLFSLQYALSPGGARPRSSSGRAPLFFAIHAGAGLSPASPDATIGAEVGWRLGAAGDPGLPGSQNGD